MAQADGMASMGVRSLIDNLRNDVRYAIRQMVRAPMVTLVTITILAIGIGVNSALFSFVDSLVFKPVPGVEQGDRLVKLKHKRIYGSMSYGTYAFLHDNQDAFDGIAVEFGGRSIAVDVDGSRTSQPVLFVNGDYYRALRPTMALGHAPPVQRDDAPSGILRRTGLQFLEVCIRR